MNKELFERLLATGVKNGASDIHFRPGAPPLYRVHRQLVPLKSDVLRAETTEAIAKLLVGRRNLDLADIDEYDTSYSLGEVGRFRANIYRQRGSFGLVLRIIPTRIRAIAELALPAVVADIALQERGLVLVTGATGSGKTTTLAAMLDHVNRNRLGHILTIEDPIEFLHANQRCSVSQRELNHDTRSFVSGMRSALRQDPDYIMVGEMRDAESIDIALKAAETGHVVYSSVHTTDAEKTVGRLIAVYPAEEQATVRLRLADNLKAVISQRLLPRADGSGMVVCAEVMIVTPSIRDALREPAQGGLRTLIEQGKEHYKTQSFDQHLTELLLSGVIARETAYAAASSPADFQRNLAFTS